MTRKLLTYILLLSSFYSLGQNEIWMRPNKGQWHENIEYKIDIPGGRMYLEKNGFTYSFDNAGEVYDEAHGHNHQAPAEGHAVKVNFFNSNGTVDFNSLNPSPFYENYFLGNDTTKWASNIRAYTEVVYQNLYDNINLRMYESNNTLKYDLILSPGANLSQFVAIYNGQESITLEDGMLQVNTPFGNITESKPIAYQIIGGIRREVNCEYRLVENRMSFVMPDGYDESSILYIDPELTFSTFTGSTSDNWGMTACPDIDKKLIAGGVVFGSGYPTSPGAFELDFNGGTVDVGITKFNEDGGAIVYSTYIGGNSSETPHSIIVNEANELYLMGATSSSDFPIRPEGYQTVYRGGPALASVDGMAFNNGSDIYVLKLSADGTTLEGGTFIGGDGNDGISEAGVDDDDLTVAYNYGDLLRGEIMLDAESNAYITSVTRSSNFPIVGGFDATLGGAQDAVVFKMNPDLTELLWSTYLGGDNLETGNSVQLSSTGDIFVAGGTSSLNFPNTTGGMKSTYSGGTVDGYLMKFPAPTYAAPNGTYLGTNEYDQAYMVQLDPDDYVYTYGNTNGNYEIVGSAYINVNSGQFIHKLSNDLSTTQWSTVFGASTGNSEISPTAFLVSDCFEIYIAGWGGRINNDSGHPSFGSTTSGFPVTFDAYQPTTSGSNFYLAVFTANMAALKYATFMGNTDFFRDHVDGGTSRFDKSGSIYHAVCAACGGVDAGFPTTPGAFSPTNPATNCNMAVFQFDLAKIEAVLSTGTPVICIPDPVDFENASEYGDTYEWDFGDGVGTSSEFEPSYYYEEPGEYIVRLVVTDSEGCFLPDTAYITVTIALFEGLAGSLEDTICPGTSVELFAVGGTTYLWGPPEFFENPTLAEPVVTITEETTFIVTIESVCGLSEVEVVVSVFDVDAGAGPDTAICIGNDAMLFAYGGAEYEWTPPDELDDPTIPNPTLSPLFTSTYTVIIITEDECVVVDSAKVLVDLGLPFPNITGPEKLCLGDTTRITASGATSYHWSPAYNISDIEVYNPRVWPSVDTSYKVSFNNACGVVYDSIFIDVVEILGSISPDTTICPGDTINLWASGGIAYSWKPRSFLLTPNVSNTLAFPKHDIEYIVEITDENACHLEMSTYVYLHSLPSISVSPEAYNIIGDTVRIWVEAEGDILWSPPYNIDCIICPETFVYPEKETTYTATVTDINGCKISAHVPVKFDPLIFVPNAFSPDGDDFNNVFKAIAHNVVEFEMIIFNRWGEVVHRLESIDDYWDGNYRGSLVKDDVYIWQIVYTDINGMSNEMRGHVTVLK